MFLSKGQEAFMTLDCFQIHLLTQPGKMVQFVDVVK